MKQLWTLLVVLLLICLYIWTMPHISVDKKHVRFSENMVEVFHIPSKEEAYIEYL